MINTEFIAHRINTSEALRKIPAKYGVELDLRDYKSDIILNHDPFIGGESFKDYLKNFNHGTIILNIKSERIEYDILDLLHQNNITKYFFLDSSFPMINQLSSQGESKIALRFSEYEGVDTIINMKNRIEWVWVDCFSRLPITKDIYQVLKNINMKLCLVSPCLVGRPEEIQKYKKYLQNEGIVFDAICCKIDNIKIWCF